MKTEGWQSNTPGLRLVGEDESGYASTNFGPVKAGLTIGHKTPSPLPEELLSYLEKEVTTLESRYLEVLDTLETAIKALVELTNSFSSTAIIDKGKDKK